MNYSRIIIVGSPGAGKTTLGQRLAEDRYTHIEASDVLHDLMQKTGTQSVYEFMSTNDNFAVAEEIYRHINIAKNNNYVITGLRQTAELEYLKSALPNAVVVSLDTPTPISYARVVKRNRPDKPDNFFEYLSLKRKQENAGMDKLMRSADFHVSGIGNAASVHKRFIIKHGSFKKKVAKTIAISGHSRSGKTTVSEMLADKLPNSVVLKCDDVFLEIPNLYPEKVLEIFGENSNAKVSSDELLTTIRAGNNTQKREYLNFAQDHVEKWLMEEKSNIPPKTKYIIVEWLNLPATENWENADFRIIVQPSSSLKTLTRQGKLKSNGGKWSLREWLERTYLSNMDVVQGASTDYTVFNDVDKSLDAEITALSEKIQDGESIQHQLCALY